MAVQTHVKHEREIGKPIKNFETRVPKSWMEKGYVEIAEKESLIEKNFKNNLNA